MSIATRKLIYVKWEDSRGVNEQWQRISDIADEPIESCIVESVGFVIREDDTGIHLAPHVNFDGEDSYYCGDMQIPASCIVERRVIE